MTKQKTPYTIFQSSNSATELNNNSTNKSSDKICLRSCYILSIPCKRTTKESSAILTILLSLINSQI
jgi:hypothetical protein